MLGRACLVFHMLCCVDFSRDTIPLERKLLSKIVFIEYLCY